MSMPAHISLDTVRALALQLRAIVQEREERFATVLHGGEPLLVGPNKLHQFLNTLREHLPHDYPVALQTNGILLTQEILDICSTANVSISVSIDGPKELHDEDRVGHNGRGTFERVIKGLELLKKHHRASFLFTGVLAVIDPASDPAEIYHFFKKLGTPSVDFLYRDGNHSKLPTGKRSPLSTEYGRWLVGLLKEYLADAEPIRVRFLDDLIKLVLGGKGTKDGAGVTDYGVMVVDTDGSITKNDTLKSSFDGADRFESGWTVTNTNLAQVLDSDEFAEYHAQQKPQSQICLNCPELNVCGGGMTLHRWENGTGFANPSIYCADQKLLINNIRHHLASATNLVSR